MILGLIFGYGKSNTEYFSRSGRIGFYLKKYPNIRLFSFSEKPRIASIKTGYRRCSRFRFSECLEPPKPLPQFKSLEDEWAWIESVKNVYRADASPPYLFRLSAYKARTGGDADDVREKSIRARDRVARIFCDRKFSEVIAEEARK
jgi:hypothetical protein